VWCGVVWCGVAWRGAARRGAARRGAAWRGQQRPRWRVREWTRGLVTPHHTSHTSISASCRAYGKLQQTRHAEFRTGPAFRERTPRSANSAMPPTPTCHNATNHATAQEPTAPHVARTAAHRSAAQRTAAQRTAPHRISPPPCVPRLSASPCAPRGRWSRTAPMPSSWR